MAELAEIMLAFAATSALLIAVTCTLLPANLS